jgi:hypothetical protein
MNTKALFVMGFLFSIASATTPTFTIGTWGNFSTCAISHTFDDYGMSTVTNITNSSTGRGAFDQYGFHMTIFVVTNWMSSNNISWALLDSAFAHGHEIASHSVTHPSGTMASSELSPSQQTIKQKVPGEMCATIAYPNCNTPGDALVLNYYIAGRNCTSSPVNSKSPSNFAEIGSQLSGSCCSMNDSAKLSAYANTAASSGGWAVYCHHGVGSDTHSYSVTNLDALKAHLKYLNNNRSTFWVETFGNVARYIKERDSSKVTVKDSSAGNITITLTNSLPDSIFDYPLSIRCLLPSGWNDPVVKQNNKTMQDTIVTVSSKQYLMFQAVPNGGDVVLSNGSVNVFNRFAESDFNGTVPVKKVHSTLIVDTKQFAGSSVSVTFINLQGKELARYNLAGTGRTYSLPIDKISRSVFIARVFGAGKTYMGTFLPQP